MLSVGFVHAVEDVENSFADGRARKPTAPQLARSAGTPRPPADLRFLSATSSPSAGRTVVECWGSWGEDERRRPEMGPRRNPESRGELVVECQANRCGDGVGSGRKKGRGCGDGREGRSWQRVGVPKFREQLLAARKENPRQCRRSRGWQCRASEQGLGNQRGPCGTGEPVPPLVERRRRDSGKDERSSRHAEGEKVIVDAIQAQGEGLIVPWRCKVTIDSGSDVSVWLKTFGNDGEQARADKPEAESGTKI